MIDFKKEDVRIIKTRRALFKAMQELLKYQTYAYLKVYDICHEAYVSRSAFYSHFKDKYDILEQWLTELLCLIKDDISNVSYEQREVCIIGYLQNYCKIIENLINQAPPEQIRTIINVLNGVFLDKSYTEIKASFISAGIIGSFYQVKRRSVEAYVKVISECLFYLSGEAQN